jgi:hypothetical protein
MPDTSKVITQKKKKVFCSSRLGVGLGKKTSPHKKKYSVEMLLTLETGKRLWKRLRST